MTARTKARCCYAGALLSLAAGLIAACWQPCWAVFGLAGAVLLAATGNDYRRAHQRTARRARLPFPDPAPLPDWEQLAEQARYDDTFSNMISHWNEDAA